MDGTPSNVRATRPLPTVWEWDGRRKKKQNDTRMKTTLSLYTHAASNNKRTLPACIASPPTAAAAGPRTPHSSRPEGPARGGIAARGKRKKPNARDKREGRGGVAHRRPGGHRGAHASQHTPHQAKPHQVGRVSIAPCAGCPASSRGGRQPVSSQATAIQVRCPCSCAASRPPTDQKKRPAHLPVVQGSPRPRPRPPQPPHNPPRPPQRPSTPSTPQIPWEGTPTQQPPPPPAPPRPPPAQAAPAGG